jgi:hypothetical protein
MKRVPSVPCVSPLILIVATLLLSTASTVHAIPLTWIFKGTTISPSGVGENEQPNLANRRFELQIFLDTTRVGTPLGEGLAEVDFGLASAALNIESLSVLPLSLDVLYFVGNGAVTGIVLLDSFSAISFSTPISNEPFLLRPIPLTKPGPDDILDKIRVESVLDPTQFVRVTGKVKEFSAVVPEAGTAVLFTSALMALVVLRGSMKRGARRDCADRPA